ncbi:hypothetical protein OIV83_006347 [Microbotryomycetes sp. JL201]|nr:hypothetical protein OIV83_006347 [Microbotryomycetes sp. JL201]
MLTRSLARTTVYTPLAARALVTRLPAASSTPPPQEPINIQRGHSRTPLYIVLALATLYAGYRTVITSPPAATPAVKGMTEATHPKTEMGKKAAGLDHEPLQRPPNPGGDFKARKPSDE